MSLHNQSLHPATSHATTVISAILNSPSVDDFYKLIPLKNKIRDICTWLDHVEEFIARCESTLASLSEQPSKEDVIDYKDYLGKVKSVHEKYEKNKTCGRFTAGSELKSAKARTEINLLIGAALYAGGKERALCIFRLTFRKINEKHRKNVVNIWAGVPWQLAIATGRQLPEIESGIKVENIIKLSQQLQDDEADGMKHSPLAAQHSRKRQRTGSLASDNYQWSTNTPSNISPVSTTTNLAVSGSSKEYQHPPPVPQTAFATRMMTLENFCRPLPEFCDLLVKVVRVNPQDAEPTFCLSGSTGWFLFVSGPAVFHLLDEAHRPEHNIDISKDKFLARLLKFPYVDSSKLCMIRFAGLMAMLPAPGMTMIWSANLFNKYWIKFKEGESKKL